MICASCDVVIPDGGVICLRCSEVDGQHVPQLDGSGSYRAVARTARLLKGLVLLSVMFGLFVAPFAIYVASRALHTARVDPAADPSVVRQVVVLRRIAVALLVFWAFILGTRVAWLLAERAAG